MKHSYRKVVAYNPIKNTVSSLRQIPKDKCLMPTVCQQAFKDVYDEADTSNDIIVGVSIGNELYQLSPAPYSNYIKEDTGTMDAINRSKFFVAVSNYQVKHHIPFEY